MPATPDDAELRQRQIADEIAGLGLCLPGSLVQRTTRCGSPRCRCHTDPSYRHGPYPSWIRKVGTKTVTPHAQPRPARAIPSPVRQHQAPPRADQRTRDTLSRDGRAGRRMDNTIRGHLRRLQRLQRRHTPDNVSSPRPESPGPYSEDTQIRTPVNGGYLRCPRQGRITQGEARHPTSAGRRS